MKISTLLLCAVLVVGSAALLPGSGAWSHCQLPCGIYNDQMRFDMIAEDITTIERSIQEIRRLEGETPVNYNQIVRWVNNKDQHADKIARILSDYFLAQRVKPIASEAEVEQHAYIEKLELIHQLMIAAMKSKQTTDPKIIVKLRALVDQFHDAYFDDGNPHGQHH